MEFECNEFLEDVKNRVIVLKAKPGRKWLIKGIADTIYKTQTIENEKYECRKVPS